MSYQTAHKSSHKCTMYGLQKWFKAKFEKLGWIVLAKEQGNTLRVRSYLQSINHLEDCLKDKIAAVHDEDSRDDLKIMLEHIDTLCCAANKLLATGLAECSNNEKHNMNDAQEATFCGLNKWEMQMFEKLGWMILSNKEGNDLKIKSYLNSIHMLKDSLYKKMENIQEKDRKDDLKILYDQVCTLWRAAIKLFGKPKGMGSMTHKSSKSSGSSKHKHTKKSSSWF